MKRRSGGPGVSFFAFQDIITAVVGIFILITLILILELTQRVEAAANRPSGNVDEIVATIESLRAQTDRLSDEYERRLAAERATAESITFDRDAEVQSLERALRAANQQIESGLQRAQTLQERLSQEQQRKIRLLLLSRELEDERQLIADLEQRKAELDRTLNRLRLTDGMIFRDTTDTGRSLCLLVLDQNGIGVKDSATKTARQFQGRDWLDRFTRWVESLSGSNRHLLLLVQPSGADHFADVHDRLSQSAVTYGFDVVADDAEAHLSFEWEPHQ